MAASGADLPRLRMRKLLLRRFLRPAASPARLTPSPGWAEVPGEGRPGRARADLGSAWPTLARRLSHEPRARSAPPPPGWAVNEALQATWGASSAWCPGRQSRLSARPAGGRHGLRRPRPRRQVKTDGLSLSQQVLRGPLAPRPARGAPPESSDTGKAFLRWLGPPEVGVPLARPPPPGTRRS